MQPSPAPSFGMNRPAVGPCAMVGPDELPECLQEYSLAGGPSFGGPSFGGSVGGPIVGPAARVPSLPAALDRCCPVFDLSRKDEIC